MKLIEYKLREVKRYIVTCYADQGDGCQQSSVIGEYDNADTAYAVGYAMCKNEHFMLGWPLDDERIQYPLHPEQCADSRATPFVAAGNVIAAVSG